MFDEAFGENIRICSEQDLFRRLQMGRDGKSALILGYKIVLTDAEYRILNALYESDSPISKYEFEKQYGIMSSSIPVHVVHINKKALPITGRRLIENLKSDGYRISNTM